MRPILLILCFALPVYSQTLEYDKFTDTEYYKSKQIEVYRNKGGLLVYNPARVKVQAFKILRHAGFRLALEVDSVDWQFTQACSVQILADTKRYQFPCLVDDSKAYSLGREVYVTEYLRATIPVPEFKAILQSKVIEMRVGTYQFKLKDKHAKELLTVDIPEITTSP